MASQSVQRRALEDELRLVLEQKAMIEAQLATLRGAGRASLPALKTGSQKRAPGVPSKVHAPPTKKQKVEDRAKRKASLWGQMVTVLKQISKQRDATHFLVPVDADKLKVPDYYKIVKKPMDLGTIKTKLEHKPERGQYRQYKDPYEFATDVRQVWTNCRLYNPEGHPVRQMGDRLSDAWEKKWHSSQIEAKWEALMREEKEEQLGPGIVPHRLKEMGQELKELNKMAAPPSGAPVPSGPREFNFEDKRRLSQQLGSLPGERLPRVLDIISRSSTLPMSADGETEVDIDMLDNNTLLQLEEYVDSVLEEQQKKEQSGKAERAAQQKAAIAEQETTSRPSDAGGAKPGRGAPPPAAAAAKTNGSKGPGAAAAANAAAAAASVSSRSSASSGSSSSSDDSMGEVGSKRDDASSGGDVKQTAADQSTLVSTTHPQQAPPIYQPKSRKDVTLQNEGAWGALAASAAKPAGEGKDGGGGNSGRGSGEPASSAPGEQDALWSEFASREQQQRKREAEKAAEEEKRRAEKARKEEEVRKEAEERRKEAEAAVAAERAKAEEAERRAQEEVEEQRRREMAALEGAQPENNSAAPEMMGRFDGGGGAALAELGLFKKAAEDDDEDDDDEDEDMDEREEGEA